MRLWSIHPKYLDHKGLVALWREALLAQKVLRGGTKGYTKHPQLVRFRECGNPLGAIATYLYSVWEEATRRGYSFDKSKIGRGRIGCRISVTDGQVKYEFSHLKKKLRVRSPKKYREINNTKRIDTHPLFRLRKGKIEEWERTRTGNKG